MSNEIVESKLSQIQAFDLEKARFQFLLEKARFYSQSTMVPMNYRQFVTKKVKEPGEKYPVERTVENPAALGNCLIVIGLANRIGVDEIMLMQCIDVIEGKTRWSGKGAIAAINSCGRFSPLEWTKKDLGEKEVDYSEWAYVERNGKNERAEFKKKIKIQDFEMVAYATDLKSGKVLMSPPVTIEMAVKLGWYTKSNSFWSSMPDNMAEKRAASWFADKHCPDVLMGMRTIEEEQDMIKTVEAVPNEDGVYETIISEEDVPVSQSRVDEIKDQLSGKNKAGRPKKEKIVEAGEVESAKTPDPEQTTTDEPKIPIMEDPEDDIAFN